MYLYHERKYQNHLAKFIHTKIRSVVIDLTGAYISYWFNNNYTDDLFIDCMKLSYALSHSITIELSAALQMTNLQGQLYPSYKCKGSPSDFPSGVKMVYCIKFFLENQDISHNYYHSFHDISVKSLIFYPQFSSEPSDFVSSQVAYF